MKLRNVLVHFATLLGLVAAMAWLMVPLSLWLFQPPPLWMVAAYTLVTLFLVAVVAERAGRP